jgi:hypothetical protein
VSRIASLLRVMQRNMSAFVMYSNDIRAAVRAEDPTLTFPNTAREIARRWKELTPEQRQVCVLAWCTMRDL